MDLAGFIAVHVLFGVTAVLCGAGAMLTRKGSRRHRGFGRLHLLTLAGLAVTAPVLAAVDWTHRWPLVVLGGLALGSAAIGFTAVRLRRPARIPVHIVGMGTGYIAMLTAFYVDNGPRLPLWDHLPAAAFWLLPGLVGTPLIVRAVRRRSRRPTPGRRRARRRTSSAGHRSPSPPDPRCCSRIRARAANAPGTPAGPGRRDGWSPIRRAAGASPRPPCSR